MVAPGRVDAVKPHRSVKGECEAEELEEQTEPNAGAALQESPDRQRDEKRRDENESGDESALRLNERGHSRERLPCASARWRDGKPGPAREEAKTPERRDGAERTNVAQRHHVQTATK